MRVGINLAQERRGRLCVTTKPHGVPSISGLWEECAYQLSHESAVEVQILEIDNAAYQLIARAKEFDVIVSPNMFGDILADCGALLLGSRGVSFSGNFSPDGRAVFQTGHGAAHDIAGTGTANPIGQILSLAMLLREGFAWEDGASAIESAVAETLAMGYRTPDIAADKSHILGTQDLAERICSVLKQRLSKKQFETCDRAFC